MSEEKKTGKEKPDQVDTKLTLGRFLRVLGRYFPLLFPYWPELVLLFILLPMVGSVLVLITPLSLRIILDVAFPRGDVGLLVFLSFLAFGGVMAERTLLVLVRTVVSSHLRIRILGKLGGRFYFNILRLNMRYHHKTPVGEKIFRCDTDILDTAEMIGTQIPMMIQFFLQFVVTVAAMCMIDSRPLLVAVCFSPIFFIVAQYLYNIYRRVDLKQRVMGQDVTARLEETLAAPEVVYSHGARRREGIKYYRSLVNYSVQNMIYWFMNEVSIVIVWPSGLPIIFSSFVVGVVGSYLMVVGEMTLGEYTAVLALIIQAIVPLGILINYYQALRLRMVPAERIINMFDSEERMKNSKDKISLPKIKGELEFKNVHFAYDPAKPVLKGVSFKIKPGSRVAFVGPSGIGKSTIMNLFLRFYDPDQGQVYVDGLDLKKISLEEYRQKVGIVLQEPVLFDGTVRENILYGAPDITEEEFLKSVEVADLDEFINDFPDGYETYLKGGGDLALGQKQRISVARCIARKPSIVLLDEPTSLVDPASKQSIVDAIDKVAKGRTAIFISHDLLTLKDLDEIIVLNEGVVAERGTHEELVKKKGLYFNLWQMQIHRSSEGRENT